MWVCQHWEMGKQLQSCELKKRGGLDMVMVGSSVSMYAKCRSLRNSRNLLTKSEGRVGTWKGLSFADVELQRWGRRGLMLLLLLWER